MERIRLSKREKHVLRTLGARGFDALSEFDHSSIRTLHDMGLVKGAFTEGGDAESARLTTKGKEYMLDNPHLRNPVDWTKVWAIAAVFTAIIAAIALFIACSMR